MCIRIQKRLFEIISVCYIVHRRWRATLLEKLTFWQAWPKAQALTNDVQLSRKEIQTWNQDIGSKDIDSGVEDDDQEKYIITTAEISTTEAMKVFNKVIAWSENNISDTRINDLLTLRKCRDKALQKFFEAKKCKKVH